MLVDQQPVTVFEIAPAAADGVRHDLPAALARPAFGRHETVWHRALDIGTDLGQVVGQLAGIERQLPGHHPAADVDTDRGRNDCALGRDHRADGGAGAIMTIRHGGHMLVDDRQPRHVLHLVDGVVLNVHVLGPHFDR